MCLNWKVIAGAGAVAGAVYLAVPSAFAAALPLLVLAICPLSMLVMMKMMAGGNHASCEPTSGEASSHVASSREELEAELQRLRARETAIADQLDAVTGDDTVAAGEHTSVP